MPRAASGKDGQHTLAPTRGATNRTVTLSHPPFKADVSHKSQSRVVVPFMYLVPPLLLRSYLR